MSNKGKGIRFERIVRKYFEEKLECFVIRQAASTFPDLIAFTMKDGIIINDVKVIGIIGIECKVRGRLDEWEIKFLKKLKEVFNFNTYLAYSGNTMKDVELREIS